MDFDINQWFSAISAVVAGRIFLAWLPGLVASKRGRSFWLGFFLALVVHWLPALLIMSVLPEPGQRQGRDPEDMEHLEREKRRMEDAERRAQASPAAPAAPSEPDGPIRSRQVDRQSRTARQVSAPSLPVATVQPLPADLHPDPLADAPRANLRGGTGSTNVTPADKEAAIAASADQAAAPPTDAADHAEGKPDTSSLSVEPAPIGKSARRASLSADGSST